MAAVSPSTIAANEPVFVALNGLGLLANTFMVLLSVFGVIEFTEADIIARALAIQGFVNAAAAVIRPLVTPNSRVDG
jgi:hypothetical protein